LDVACTFVAASRAQGFIITVELYYLVLIIQFVQYVPSLIEFTTLGLALFAKLDCKIQI
jgi:hypothetical protein